MRGRALRLPVDLTARIDDAELARLLGYPSPPLPDGPVRDLVERTRAWFARHGRPWVFWRQLAIVAIDGPHIDLEDGTRLTSPLMARRLRTVGATALAAAGASAGPQVDRRSTTLWERDRPDEAFVLDRFGVAVVEHLAGWTARRLRARSRRADLAPLPGYSPGYAGWPLADQRPLARCLLAAGRTPGPLEVFESGALRPRSSLLAAFGLTPRRDVAAAAWRRQTCSWCALADCDLRRRRPRNGADLGTMTDERSSA